VHSIYDIWGIEPHTQEEWVQAGNHCWEAIQIRYSACGDAVGHAAYESAGEDLRQAMIICDWQREIQIQTPCANGAYMQANFPQSTKLKQAREVVLRDPSDWGDFVTFCDTVPNLIPPPMLLLATSSLSCILRSTDVLSTASLSAR
jgi:hypothetical protein